MPEFEVKSPAAAVGFVNLDDWKAFMEQNMYMVGLDYGFRVTIEPITQPKTPPATEKKEG